MLSELVISKYLNLGAFKADVEVKRSEGRSNCVDKRFKFDYESPKSFKHSFS